MTIYLQVLKKTVTPTKSWGPANPSDRAGTVYDRTSGANNDNETELRNGTENGAFVVSQMTIPPYEEASKL